MHPHCRPRARALRRIRNQVAAHGFAHVPAKHSRALLASFAAMQDDAIEEFISLWEQLPLDPFMADGGQYRRRVYLELHARLEAHRVTWTIAGNTVFHQTADVNPLNGGVARRFAPLPAYAINNPILDGLLRLCAALTHELDDTREWIAELHPIRIVCCPDQRGEPTPEGIHRDGRNYVYVVMLKRHNIEGGASCVYDEEKNQVASLIMSTPFELIALDDRRAFHAVTPVHTRDPGAVGIRDVLVITFRHASNR